jgi:hypothetical protein
MLSEGQFCSIATVFTKVDSVIPNIVLLTEPQLTKIRETNPAKKDFFIGLKVLTQSQSDIRLK